MIARFSETTVLGLPFGTPRRASTPGGVQGRGVPAAGRLRTALALAGSELDSA